MTHLLPAVWQPSRMAKHGFKDLETRTRIVRWIEFKMKVRGLNQKDAAEKLGVDASALSRARKGGAMGLEFILSVHRGFQIPIGRLFHGEPGPGDE